VHALKPHWFSGVTLQGFHNTEARMLAATGREAIEIDLATRKWQRREFEAAVRGVCYFESGLAVLLADELLLLPTLDGEPTLRVATTTRSSAQMGSFHGHRVLWVPTGGDGNVFLTRRDGDLVVVGVLRAPASGYHQSPDGEFLSTSDSAMSLPDWEAVLDRARPWAGRPLDRIRSPRITLRTS